jgi:hypothetical protein
MYLPHTLQTFPYFAVLTLTSNLYKLCHLLHVLGRERKEEEEEEEENSALTSYSWVHVFSSTLCFETL